MPTYTSTAYKHNSFAASSIRRAYIALIRRAKGRYAASFTYLRIFLGIFIDCYLLCSTG